MNPFYECTPRPAFSTAPAFSPALSMLTNAHGLFSRCSSLGPLSSSKYYNCAIVSFTRLWKAFICILEVRGPSRPRLQAGCWRHQNEALSADFLPYNFLTQIYSNIRSYQNFIFFTPCCESQPVSRLLVIWPALLCFVSLDSLRKKIVSAWDGSCSPHVLLMLLQAEVKYTCNLILEQGKKYIFGKAHPWYN